MKITDLIDSQTLISDIAQCAGLIHSYGWAEANAGNLSIDVTSRVISPKPNARYYIVSRTGSRYRQTAIDPLRNLLLIEVASQESFFPSDAKPTMEWISHRCLQLAIGNRSVILHTHPAEIIALAALDISEADLNQSFARLLPELPLYLPEGIAVAPLRSPGSKELCEASLQALTGQKALIWSGHGILCFGNSLDEALDYMEIIVKAARIFLLLR